MKAKDDESWTQTVTKAMCDGSENAPQWIAITLALISDTLDDIATALEQPAPRRKRARK